MEYKEYKPCKLLSNFVECYWTALADRPPFREKESLIPDGTIELMFNFGDNYSKFKNGIKTPVKGSHIIGIRKKTLQISQTNKQNIFSVRFKLGGVYPVIKIPVYSFANDFFELDLLLGNEYKELEEKLYETLSTKKRIEIIEDYLLKKIYGNNMDDYNFVEACSKLLLQNPSMDIKTLSDNFNTNYKTIERKFQKVMGLTPTELLKIRRFNNAVFSMYSCKYNSLTAIAYKCGYFDQSHFIREFKQLTTFSPKEFLKEQFTIVQVIQPALAERLSKMYNL